MPPKRSAKLSEEFIDDSDASDVDGDYGEKKKPQAAPPKRSPAKKPAAKRAKKEESSDEELGEGGSGGVQTNSQGDAYVPLNSSGTRRITVRAYRGNTLIDIREMYEKDGEYLPGKKGISLTGDQWKKLKESMEVVDAAIEAL